MASFYCSACNLTTNNKYNYTSHLNTKKHKINVGESAPINNISCNLCNKTYLTTSGLWKHQQKCKENTVQVSNKNFEELKEELTKLKEYIKTSIISRESVVELVNSTPPQIYNNCTINLTQNINFFLDKNCNNAVNIDDFFDTIKSNITDKNINGIINCGKINGIIDIVVNALDTYSIHKRPLHCIYDKNTNKQTVHVRQSNYWQTTGNLDKNLNIIEESEQEEQTIIHYDSDSESETIMPNQYIITDKFVHFNNAISNKIYSLIKNMPQTDDIKKLKHLRSELIETDLKTQYLMQTMLIHRTKIDKSELISLISC